MLIIAGAPSVGKSTLVSQLIGGEIPPSNTSGVRQWVIDTKYYSADVEILEISGSFENFASDKLDEAEGLVVVFDATLPETFEIASTWAGAASNFGGNEVLLCVASKANLVEPEAWEGQLEKYSNWCFDNGFELIEWHSTANENAEKKEEEEEEQAKQVHDGEEDEEDDETKRKERPAGGLLSDDSTGIDRIVEALHCNMWNSMQRKDRSAGIAKFVKAMVEDEEEEERKEEEEAAAAKASNSNDDNNEGSSKNANENNEAKEGDVVQESKESAKETAAASAAAATTRRIPEPKEIQDDDDEGHDMEKEMDEFSKMLGELKGAREHAQSLPDQERREYAARMAMRLMQMFANDEDGSEASSISSDDE